ncbi:hypothetical protein [Mycolicibacterium sp. F2034L]|uniref:hypothetical protein n=1 Tax=Mycolicibacterium sp. F2034L TaxID=2926422 RepID=UPI001FF559C7|nr:hypothetical protein [Mycolicibacterium sp. F2034L]MCK0174820.1 hypothetical protein [Mycolicibacterium sp. F2034L]
MGDGVTPAAVRAVPAAVVVTAAAGLMSDLDAAGLAELERVPGGAVRRSRLGPLPAALRHQVGHGGDGTPHQRRNRPGREP